MAKRKRLTPAQPDYFNSGEPAPETKSMPGIGTGTGAAPIAQVASDTATRAALDEVTSALQDARSQGRLIEALALTSIDARYLIRDRLVQDDDDMDSLLASLRARGQQTPIEVTALSGLDSGRDDGIAYGLISGWRRLTALSRLYKETGEDRFATIKALVIAPESAQDAYLAMVEENEIRANLSLYERARIALRASREGVFPTPRHAVLGLFGATTRTKRSRISRFVALVEALENKLVHPTAIPEKLGLELVKAFADDPETLKNLQDRLLYENPLTVAAELQVLSEAVALAQRPGTGSASAPESLPKCAAPDPAGPVPGPIYDELVAGLQVRLDRSGPPRIELVGARVDEALFRALKDWLAVSYAESQK